ncbi:hypothetical protein MKW94_027799 [Papaver nudicaule]|uniref:Small ribosomal subunit protein uS8c n=1 Tax=Papaver nudicaule TaxID=74823 RepID=A0AA41S3G5_PAPNU|nr:hypothetical protein [Papaver nudicaule]
MDKKGTVRIASTNITENIVKILLREGFIENVRKHRESNKISWKGPYITILKRISRPGLRIYSNAQRIPRILGGMGIVILSTSRGIMTDREARLEGIVGEILKDWLPNITPPPLVDTSRGLPEMKEQKWIHEGLITESLPNVMFRVRLDNEDLILGYVSGRIRRSFIRILPGNKVKIEVSRYDSTRGLIIYRLRNKDSND